MTGQCSSPGCYPEETGCNEEGLLDYRKCPHYRGDKAQKTDTEPTQESDLLRRSPWTGNTFGLQDLNLISARGKLILIGLAGAENAGKTTFLAALFCLLRQGKEIEGYRFAGSYTLAGWEGVASYLTWTPHSLPQFPPHTSINAGRVPGLLHLALKDEIGSMHDVIFTDAPGEWFTAWANSKEDELAEGARWVFNYSNGILLFADCAGLSGASRGNARNQFLSLFDRIKEGINSRPLALIWSKSDIMIDTGMKEAIRKTVTSANISKLEEFEVSTQPGHENRWQNNFHYSISWILRLLKQRRPAPLPMIIPQTTEDLFLLRR